MNQYRKSPRAKWLEYNEGLYFITVCTHKREHYFGEIIDAEMHLSPIGKYLYEELENASVHHPHINILQFVVMPNHFHAIVDVTNAARCVPTIDRMTNGLKSSQRPLLSTYIGSFEICYDQICPCISIGVCMAIPISRPLYSWGR